MARPILGPPNGGQPHRPAKEFLEQASGHELMRLLADLAKPPIRFGDFVEQITGLTLEPWQWHLANRLERLVHEKGQRLLIHKPPRFGGSTIVSQCFPAYLMGRDPMITFREVTHNQEHSEDFSKTVQEVIYGPEYQAIFPATRIPRQTNLTEWSTTRKLEERRRDPQPSYRAIGVAGSATGVGGQVWVIDDVYGSAKEAHSTATNAEVRRWHRELLIPRLTPESNLIVMYHRFHNDDYAGWLERQGGWEILRYAALADGEDPPDPMGRMIDVPLAPNRFDWEYLDKLRRSDPVTFYGLYQGKPENPEGEAVHRSWFPIQRDWDDDETGVPAFDPKLMLGVEIYFDIGAAEGRDETVGTLGAAFPNQFYTWLWQMSGSWNPGERDAKMVEFCVMVNNFMKKQGHPVKALLEEGIGLGREAVNRIVLQIRGAGVAAEAVRSVGSKWERANNRQDSFRSAAQAGRVRLYDGDFLKPIGLTNARPLWIEPYLREITQLQVKTVGGTQKLVGKDNKWDSGTGLHNGLILLGKRAISAADRRALMRRFG